MLQILTLVHADHWLTLWLMLKKDKQFSYNTNLYSGSSVIGILLSKFNFLNYLKIPQNCTEFLLRLVIYCRNFRCQILCNKFISKVSDCKNSTQIRQQMTTLISANNIPVYRRIPDDRGIQTFLILVLRIYDN